MQNKNSIIDIIFFSFFIVVCVSMLITKCAMLSLLTIPMFVYYYFVAEHEEKNKAKELTENIEKEMIIEFKEQNIKQRRKENFIKWENEHKGLKEQLEKDLNIEKVLEELIKKYTDLANKNSDNYVIFIEKANNYREELINHLKEKKNEHNRD